MVTRVNESLLRPLSIQVSQEHFARTLITYVLFYYFDEFPFLFFFFSTSFECKNRSVMNIEHRYCFTRYTDSQLFVISAMETFVNKLMNRIDAIFSFSITAFDIIFFPFNKVAFLIINGRANVRSKYYLSRVYRHGQSSYTVIPNKSNKSNVLGIENNINHCASIQIRRELLV